MTRNEFLKQLREALENDLSGPVVQENIDYYNQYIKTEISNGRSEQEVIAMLGDPWVLARTVIDTHGGGESGFQDERYTYEADRQRKEQAGNGGGIGYIFGLDTWWKKLLLVLAVIGIIVVIFTVITGLISLLLPILIPLFIIGFVIRLFNNR